MLVAAIFAASAQVDAASILRAQQNGTYQQQRGGYGQNPYENPEEEEKQPQDTTKKEKRIKKPLESYFFSDSIRALRNFTWHIEKNKNYVDIEPLDTTLTKWRLDYPHQWKRLGNASTGGLGQASIPINYFERSESREFLFTQPYDAYTYREETVSFYNMKHPFIWLTYLESGQKRYKEEHFEILTSQNISPSTSVGISYRARGARGKYDRSRIKNQNFAGTFAHTGKRYSIHGAYFHNLVEQEENGGVVGEWAVRDTVFEMPSGIPMRLSSANAKNRYANNGFIIKQSIGIPLQRMTEKDFSMADLSSIYIGHTLSYNSWGKTYTDKYSTYTNERAARKEDGSYVSVTDTYYKSWYQDPMETRDSTYESLLSNRFFIQAQPWDRNGIVGTIDGGVGIDNHKFSQFTSQSYITGKMTSVKKTSWFAYASINGKFRKYIDWGADFKLYPSGYKGGEYSIGGNVAFTAFIKRHPLTLKGEFRQSAKAPGFWHENWYSNHYIWSNEFSKEKETKFHISLEAPTLGIEVGVWQSLIQDKIYYGADALPAQHDGTLSLTSIYVQKDFTIAGKLHLNHRILAQLSSNQEVMPLPKVSAFLSYFYEFWVKRNVLRMQIGLDARYNTSYYAPEWMPATSVFYNQREVKAGNYPYIDAFVSAKWKRMRILIKYQHLNKGLFGNNDYFQIAKYPLNPGMLKIGISWAFYD